MLDSPIGQGLFGICKRMFAMFQRGLLPDADDTFTFVSHYPGYSVVAPDLRTERRPDRILGSVGWQAVAAAFEEIPTGAQVILMSSVPLLGPRLSWLEHVADWIPGVAKYKDDLRDQWQSRSHRFQWQKMLSLIEQKAMERALTMTVLSGEIHLATQASMPFSNGGKLTQLVASGIAHPPPPLPQATAAPECRRRLSRPPPPPAAAANAAAPCLHRHRQPARPPPAAAAAAPGDGTGLGWPRGRASRPRRSRPMPPHGRRGRVTGRTYVPAAAGYHGVWYSFGVSTGMGCTGGAARAPREPEGDSPGHRGGRLPHAVPTPSRKSRGACVLRVCFRVETDANTRTPTSTARPFRTRGAHVRGWLERRHEPAKHGRLLPAIASIV